MCTLVVYFGKHAVYPGGGMRATVRDDGELWAISAGQGPVVGSLGLLV